MPNRLKIPKINIGSKIKTLKKDIERDIKTQIATDIIAELDNVVAPFSYATFSFIIEDKSTDDTIKLEVLPVDEELDRADDPNRGTVNSRILFQVLNEGSENQVFRIMPKDFENETTPNSLETSAKTYDRDDIFADSSRKGSNLEARNWTEIIIQKLEPTVVQKTRRILTTATRNIFR